MTRINTNVASLVARRALGVNNMSLNIALNRLSTGLRINSGKDDPAGLIASETLRSSLRAITQAIDNARRADTVVAVAEGGLQEISSLLLELESLVDGSASEAGLTNAEIAANQSQIDSILQSVTRIADQAAFGDTKLLNGNFDFTTSGININEATGAVLTDLNKVQINAAKIPNASFRTVNVNVLVGSGFATASAQLGGVGSSGELGGVTSATTTIEVRGEFGSEVISFASGTSVADIVTAINSSSELTGVSAITSGTAAAGQIMSVLLTSTSYGSDAFVSVSVLENVSTFSLPGGAEVKAFGTDGTITINGSNGIVNGLNVSVRAGALDLDLTLTSTFGGTTGGATSFEITGGGAIFAISPNVGLSGQETLGISEVSAGKLGNKGIGFLTTLGSGQTNDLSSKNFASAQRIVREAISQIAKLRGRLGAFQRNTLQTTINSLLIARENITAAESAIRDADFAVETSNLTRAQILVNSSTAALQIANTQPQNVLALLG
ncbi:MAG: flagellin [Planctomycetes bacterium]|nr:flagellin [Planctomycetota bacterium]